jgi:hypothetical protein
MRRYMELHPTNQWRIKPYECLLLRFKKWCEEEDGKTPITSFEIASLWEFDMDDNNEATS